MTARAGYGRPDPIRWHHRLGAAIACIVWPPLLEVLPLHRLVKPVGSQSLIPAGIGRDESEAFAHIVDAWLTRAPWPWRRTCLRRALVLQRLLAARGFDVTLVVGVRKVPDTIEAHAWLESGGVPILERLPDAVPTFQVLSRFPEPA